MSSGQPTVAVFAPTLFITVTIEAGENDSPEIHFHVGGQGFWVARMVREFDERPILSAPVGGETGDVLRGLMASTRLDFGPVETASGAPAYIHDRRDGERVELAMTRSQDLTRHELDDLFGKTLRHAIGTGVCVGTGRPDGNDLDPDWPPLHPQSQCPEPSLG
ncbi:MAG: hypothetical protein GEU79_13350 [Acidimicrobiia bacterium]|nr:hypothetical protein [Acidimicrobiia bacterium]